jgi:multidrug efflux pump subunit AcrB
MNKLIAFFVDKGVFVNLLSVAVLVVGLGSLVLTRREVFPNVTFEIITVVTIVPGASAEEVEKLVTNPIEQDLQEVDGIKKLTSKSIEGRSLVIAQLDPDQTTEAKGKQDIQDVVDRVTLPTSAQEPLVQSIKSSQTPIIQVSAGGDIPELELRAMGRELEKRIEQIPGVARVVYTGLRDKEIHVEADPEKLKKYRLSLDDIIRALNGQNRTISAGTLEVNIKDVAGSEKIVRTVGEFTDLKDVENTIVRANEAARSISVSDVAKVYFSLERTQAENRTNGLPSLGLTVLKKETADAINVVAEVKRVVSTAKLQLDPRLQIAYINDFSSLIERRLGVLSGNLLLGLFLVIVILTVTMKFRVALLVGLGIPFSFLATMVVFYNQGYSLNLISLIGLIIVSGMLVDDAIVVTDNAVRLMEEGEEPYTAAKKATQQIWPSVTASVLTTVVAFLPMMFMSGIFGKFVRQIPLGVIFALLFSLLEAFFILPSHIATWVRIPKRSPKDQPRNARRVFRFLDGMWENRILPKYLGAVRFLVDHRYWASFGAVLLFVSAVLVARFGMRFVLFPPDGAEIFFVRFEAPPGTSLMRMIELSKPAEKVVAELPKDILKDFVTNVGLHQDDPNDVETRRGPEYAQIVIYLQPPEIRSATLDQVIERLRGPMSQVPGISRVTFDQMAGGPPVGKPVSLSVRSEEYSDILPAVKALKELMKSIPGVTDINDSYLLGKKELVVRVNGPEAASAGLSVASIGVSIRAAFEGIEATSVRQLDEELVVRVLLPREAREKETTLREFLLPNAQGQLIPLKSVARIEEAQNLSVYEHDKNRREVRVTAEVDLTKSSAVEANRKLKKLLPEVNIKYPKVEIAFGGEDADTVESMMSLARAFVVAGLAIFLILVFTFHNLLQPLLVMLTIPLGITAVIFTFLVHGRPLSFMGMLGIIALAGVIVNNAIILVDFVNQARLEGASDRDSIIDSAHKRLRPIMLTTLTTVVGLLPTAYGIGGTDPFVIPIALGLGWGLLFGSLLSIFIFPAGIAILDDLSEVQKWLARRLSKLAKRPS